jgi:hypothetical protein
MDRAGIVLLVLKLLLGGFTAFLAILLWAKIANGVCIAFLIAALTSYVGIVMEVLEAVHIITFNDKAVAGIPLGALIFTIVPFVFYIIAFVMMLVQVRQGAKEKGYGSEV